MEYIARTVDARLDRLIGELPALLLTGPRACGKSTTAARRARTILRLDVPGVADVVADDPDAALRDLPEPVLIDEWQVVPDVLAVVKRMVDADPRGGRFLLAGSAQAPTGRGTWPGTGRVVHLPMWPLSQAELLGRPDSRFIDRLASDGVEAFTESTQTLDAHDYVALALRGGFPDAALRSQGAAEAWLASYAEHIVSRDVPGLSHGRDERRLRRYLRALATCSATVVAQKTLIDTAGVTRPTAEAYDALLAAMYLTDDLPAWSNQRLTRLVRGARRHLVDSGLAGALLRVDASGLRSEPDLLGRLIETWVVAQLRVDASGSPARPELHHLRQADGRHEIDVIAELPGGRVVAIEVKATARPASDDARHLAWLRDQIGDRFLAGVVLHTGPRVRQLGDRLTALPISCLWAP